jgi:hypothetical protein
MLPEINLRKSGVFVELQRSGLMFKRATNTGERGSHKRSHQVTERSDARSISARANSSRTIGKKIAGSLRHSAQRGGRRRGLSRSDPRNLRVHVNLAGKGLPHQRHNGQSELRKQVARRDIPWISDSWWST